ncbi:unnamed protein product, partial [Meganyctiphanes norvegica]
MLASVAIFLITTWTVKGTGIQVTSRDRPRDCKNLIQQGKTHEGNYIVYPGYSAASKASIAYCTQDDGMEILSAEATNREPARNCLDLLHDGMNISGLNIIYPYLEHPAEPVLVLCDQETEEGGWTVIQNRYDGSEDFYRPWTEYVDGFGSPDGEHYIGNAIISALTAQSVNELRVDLEDWDNATAYAQYQAFHIDANHHYLLSVGMYHGTAGDSLNPYYAEANGTAFSTFDADHDLSEDFNCAEERCHGAWWYVHCGGSNLNGRYYPSDGSDLPLDGMFWYTFGWFDSLKSSKMMTRPSTATNT